MKPVSKPVSPKKKNLGASRDKLVTSRQLNRNRLATIGQLDNDEEILLDCILDDIAKDEVLIGATVKLKDLKTGEELEYTLVSEEEADYEQNKISMSSPVGSGLMNHKENDTVEIKVPAGVLKYKILKITR